LGDFKGCKGELKNKASIKTVPGRKFKFPMMWGVFFSIWRCFVRSKKQKLKKKSKETEKGQRDLSKVEEQ